MDAKKPIRRDLERELDREELLRILGGAECWGFTIVWGDSRYCIGIDPDAPNPCEEPLSCKTYCFGAGTAVHVPGGHRPIDALASGDRVLAFDASAGRVTEARVAGIDIHTRRRFPLLRVRDADECLRVTPGHRFLDVDGWRPIEAMQGARALDVHERSRQVEIRKDVIDVTERVYNVRVEGFDNYFVGRRGWLVRHN